MIKLSRPVCPDARALKTNYKHPINKEALVTASHDKCMYCESKISHIYYGDIEHIKPKSVYPEMEYEWENLGYVCARCNGQKTNKYDESVPFINPYEENPSNFIVALGPYLRHLGGNERGELTIKEIDLNRTELVERRLSRMKAIGDLIDKIKRTQNSRLRSLLFEELKKEVGEDKEYSTVVSTCAKLLLPFHTNEEGR